MPEGGGKLPPPAVRGSNGGGVLCQERHDRDASESRGVLVGMHSNWQGKGVRQRGVMERGNLSGGSDDMDVRMFDCRRVPK